MGRIVGGIGSSHAPSFGPVYDKGQQKDPMWAPLFDGYLPVRAWLETLRPDLFIVVYNDHMNRFFLDAYPTFALGASDTYPQADEGWGKRDLLDMPGDPVLAAAGRSLIVEKSGEVWLGGQSLQRRRDGRALPGGAGPIDREVDEIGIRRLAENVARHPRSRTN